MPGGVALQLAPAVLVLGAVWFNLALVKTLYLHFISADPASLYFLSPCAFAPLLITLLLGRRAGLFAVILVSMLASLLSDRTLNFLLISLLSGFTAVYFARSVRKRADLIKAGAAVGCLSLLCAVVLGLVVGRDWHALATEAAFGIGAGLGTALIVGAILPLFESAFQITTTISWLELADLNHPLLQQMTMEAPGTYHHSLLVANLVESGAKAIGLDGTACRVMAYFHDIGKIIKPEYFSENMPPGANPHGQPLAEHERADHHRACEGGRGPGAQVPAQAADAGGDPAASWRLGRELFSPARAATAADAKEGGKIMNMREEDVPDVSENSFRYPGPRPQTKEVALLSLADAVEASSRSLEKPTAQRIEDMVNENRRAQDRRPPIRRVPLDHERDSRRRRGHGGDGQEHAAHPDRLR